MLLLRLGRALICIGLRRQILLRQLLLLLVALIAAIAHGGDQLRRVQAQQHQQQHQLQHDQKRRAAHGVEHAVHRISNQHAQQPAASQLAAVKAAQIIRARQVRAKGGIIDQSQHIFIVVGNVIHQRVAAAGHAGDQRQYAQQAQVHGQQQQIGARGYAPARGYAQHRPASQGKHRQQRAQHARQAVGRIAKQPQRVPGRYRAHHHGKRPAQANRQQHAAQRQAQGAAAIGCQYLRILCFRLRHEFYLLISDCYGLVAVISAA